jgi:predicted transcriptional regulator YdeE
MNIQPEFISKERFRIVGIERLHERYTERVTDPSNMTSAIYIPIVKR